MVRWSVLGLLLLLNLFGCYELYQLLAEITNVVYTCSEHPDVAMESAQMCPQGDRKLEETRVESWWSLIAFEGKFLGVVILLRQSVYVAAGVFLFVGWILYRVLNWARAAEFLIDTEGEMRKVAWPDRKQFVGASVVVIVLTIFIAGFLFGVDELLSFVLRKLDIGI